VTEELVIIGFQELGTCRLVPCQQFLADHKKITNAKQKNLESITSPARGF